jgi:crotonobetainyl-CoA:carnitine CoA-transferase CaiB-like acyl-CoA transferase
MSDLHMDAAIAFQWPEGMAGHTWVGSGTRGARARFAQDLIFETRDGYITAGAVSDAEWEGLCRAVEKPEWLEDDRFATAAGRVLHAGERLTLLQEVLHARPSAEWLQRFEDEDVPCAPVLSREELPTHPQIVENRLIDESVHPEAGGMRQPRPAERFSETPSAIRAPSPRLGQHSDEVLEGLGLEREEIERLRKEGIVG